MYNIYIKQHKIYQDVNALLFSGVYDITYRLFVVILVLSYPLSVCPVIHVQFPILHMHIVPMQHNTL